MTFESRLLVTTVASTHLNQCLHCLPRSRNSRAIEISGKAQEQDGHLANNIHVLQIEE